MHSPKPKGRNRIVKVVVIGDACVGKTSIIHRFCTHAFDTKYKATIGSDFMSRDIEVAEGSPPITMQVWDTAGQERFKGLGCSYYRGASALVICFDLTNAVSFERVSYWLDEFRSVNQTQGLTSIPVVLLGNKTDAAKLNRLVQYKQAKEWADQEGFTYFECSAKTGHNVEEAFFHTTKEILASEGTNPGDRISVFSSDTMATGDMLRVRSGSNLSRANINRDSVVMEDFKEKCCIVS